MAKINLVIDSSKPLQSGDYMILLRISSKRQQLRVSTGTKVSKDHWIQNEQKILSGRKGDPDAFTKNIHLTKLKNDCDLQIISNHNKVDKMNVFELRAFLFNKEEEQDTDFFRYSMRLMDKMKSQGRIRTARSLGNTREKIRKFWTGSSLDMRIINVVWLEKFADYCKKPVSDGEKRKPMTINGVASYMRYLRLVMSDAVKLDVIDNYPFLKYKIKTVDTIKRNLSFEDVCKIRDYQTEVRSLQIASDIWMLMFYLRGISPKDIFFMKSSDLVYGRIAFNRFKTQTAYDIKVEPEAQAIISKYQGLKYLLWFAENSLGEREPLMKAHARKTRWQWKDEEAWGKMINDGLSKIQKELKINPSIDLTCYTSRHSVATLLRSEEVDVSVDDVALVLGHKRQDTKITAIYTEENKRKADKAMRKLLDELTLHCTAAK